MEEDGLVILPSANVSLVLYLLYFTMIDSKVLEIMCSSMSESKPHSGSQLAIRVYKN